MNRLLMKMAATAFAACVMLTSCHSDDPDAGSSPVTGPVDNELITPTAPEQGWSGNSSDGVLKFAPYAPEDDDFNSYFSFQMKGGECQEAVYNLVMPDATSARIIAQKLNSGTWIYDEDGDMDFYRSRTVDAKVIYDMFARVMRSTGTLIPTRATLTLPIPVTQSGKVLYVVLPNMKGLSPDDLETVMDIWCGFTSRIPDHVIFGTYENGVYRCSNMLGLGITYLIETEYNEAGYCVLYRTSITLPSEGWAELYYAQYEEQMADFEQQFGQRPELKRQGNTVILTALILGDFTHETIDAMVYSLDWINNRPILFNMFG